MKQQFNRARRHNNRSSHSVQPQQIFRYTNLDSSGPLGKLRGTALQLSEKYQAGAKDAQMQGDDVLMQTCQQYADHYLRLQAIAIENEQNLKAKTQTVPVQVAEEVVENVISGIRSSKTSFAFTASSPVGMIWRSNTYLICELSPSSETHWCMSSTPFSMTPRSTPSRWR